MSITSPPASATDASTTSPLPRRPNDSIEVQTRIELVEIAFRQLQAGTWISAVSVVVFALLVRNDVSSVTLAAWVSFMALPIGWAFWLARRFQTLQTRPAVDRRWALLLISATTLSAGGWGATPWVFPFLAQFGATQAAHLLLLAGLTTASARVLLPLRKGSVLYHGAIMGPVVLCYLVKGDSSLLPIIAFVLLFIYHTFWTTLHHHRTLSEAIATRFEREALAAELRAENARRESRESDLREAREQAESAGKAKGDFFARISHEIRTPMNGVLGMLRIVRDTELSPVQRDYIKTAWDSAEALLMLLNDVLDFSKIEANQLELEHALFSPATVARTVADLHHTRARDKNLPLELHLAENLPAAVLGDATRVRQVLDNLVANAIKFTDRGRVELKLECVGQNPHQTTLHFTVSDTGIGIDSDTLGQLFQPFTQADNSLGRRYGGSGLGLAISMRLAQAMGGTLQVQSTVGQGATFCFILPCQRPESTTPTPPTEAVSHFALPKLRGRVLVVEDDSINQQVIELFLKKLNVSPQFASNGEAAIRSATSGDFDLVLMDCQLPGIDGMEATRQIRQKLADKPLKIVALTANANIRDACLEAGMNDFLSKPVRFEQLAGMLQRHLPPG